MLAHLTSLLRRLAGLAVLALLLAGIPYTLLHYLGDALPTQVPTADQVTAALAAPLTDEVLGGLLVAVLWMAWAAFVWSVIVEVAAVAAGIRLPQPKAFAPTRGLAAMLVAAIAGGVLATTAAQAAPPAAAQAAPPAHIPTAVVQVHAEPVTAMPQVAAAVVKQEVTQVTLQARGKTYTYTVRPGDNLSAIAKHWLGDANRWPELFALNRDRHFPSGTLKDPKIIRPGWTLTLPDDATPPAGVTHTPDRADTPPAEPSTPAVEPGPDDTPEASADQQTPVETARAGDDGVTDHSDLDDQQAPAPQVTGVDLPTGSWIDAGLIALLLGAVALVWAHRHRRHRPASTTRTSAEVDDPMPQVVRHVRRGLRGHAATGLDRRSRAQLDGYSDFFASLRATDTTPAPGPGHPRRIQAGTAEVMLGDPADWPPLPRRLPGAGPNPADATAMLYGPSLDEPHHEHEADTVDPDDDEPDGFPAGDLAAEPFAPAPFDELGPLDVDQVLADVPPPVIPALANPVAAVWPAAGIGLTGPGADAAARGFLVAALATGSLGDLDARSTAIIPAATLAGLLGTAAIIMPATPRLTVTADLDEALDLLEEHTLHRSRLLYDHEADDAVTLRTGDPMAEPMPPLVLFADPVADHQRARIAAVLTQSRRLDIHGILLGAWPHGDTVDVGINGTTLPAAGTTGRRGRHLADHGRLTVLTYAETTDLLTVLAESHTGHPQPAPPTETGTNSPTASTLPDEAPNEENAAPLPGRPTHEDPARTDVADTHEDHIQADCEPAAMPDTSTDDSDRGDVTVTPVVVRGFGRPHLPDAPADERLRPQAVELLIYLAVRGGTASQDDILEDLLPDVTAKTAPHRLHTFTSNLRRIAGLIGGTDTPYLNVQRKQYQLTRTAFDIDIWRLRDALTTADTATDPATRIAALRTGLAAYTGPLADTGRGYDWAEPYREHLRRQAADAALTLAGLLTDHTEALTVLDTAIGHHPHAERLYQAAMRRHAAHGDLDAVKQVHRDLTRRLDDLDAEPADDTNTLYDQLMTTHRQAGTPSGRRP